MSYDDDSQESPNDLDDTCAVCGKRLNSSTRSVHHPDTCKACSGEEDDPNDGIDDFK